MTSSLTASRLKKKRLLVIAFNDILELIMMDAIERDRVNMSYYKQLSIKVKEIKNIAKLQKLGYEKFTINSEINPAMKEKPEER